LIRDTRRAGVDRTAGGEGGEMSRTTAGEVIEDYQRFKSLTYEGFRALAQDGSLSCYQRIGFPDSYRRGHEANILGDILAKLPALAGRRKVVLDIGPGCSELPRLLIDLCVRREHELILCDSPEMLAHLPDAPPLLRKVPGRYPAESGAVFERYDGRVDAIVCYSVLQYVFTEQPLHDFIDASLSLLAEGGRFLIGDIPNISKRKRFFAASAGIRQHREFTGTDKVPEVSFNVPEPGKIDDAVLLGILARCRASGFEAYLLPQAPDLPLASRREDLLIARV
jgi:hypothetical protein